MTTAQLAHHRLQNQRLAFTDLTDPADVVRWLGAVQGQEYYHALWAIGLRARGATRASVERAVAERRIVRTWPMRSTLHFVAADDARWMLELLTPRILAGQTARYVRDFGLDRRALDRCADVVVKALEGGRRLTRPGTYEALNAARIPTANSRGLHIIWALAHRRLICFGPREGPQPTIVLFDEWVPNAPPMDREEALAELARRYFTSHGPATAHDFAWWSGLRLREVAEGIALARAHLAARELEGRTYWSSPARLNGRRADSRALLLPPFDEFTVAYRDRSAVLSAAHARRASGFDLLKPTIVLDGRVVGFWSPRRDRDSARIELAPFGRLTGEGRAAVAAAVRRYQAFLGRGDDAS